MTEVFHTRACLESGWSFCTRKGCYVIATGEPVREAEDDG